MAASIIPTRGPDSALLLDAAGTLVHPREPIATTYARFAAPYGCARPEAEIGAAFGEAMGRAASRRAGSRDWRPFWLEVVGASTGVTAPALVDALIDHFARARAWRVAPGAARCCAAVRARGIKLAVVSNWSLELRPLLAELGVSGWFDALVISAEEQIEKPNPELFRRACARLEVRCADAVHVGDSVRADLEGARAAGCAAWLIGRDVADFDALAERLLGPGTIAR